MMKRMSVFLWNFAATESELWINVDCKMQGLHFEKLEEGGCLRGKSWLNPNVGQASPIFVAEITLFLLYDSAHTARPKSEENE